MKLVVRIVVVVVAAALVLFGCDAGGLIVIEHKCQDAGTDAAEDTPTEDAPDVPFLDASKAVDDRVAENATP